MAIQVLTYINKNETRLNDRSYEIAFVNDSLYLDSSMNFIRDINFDSLKLIDFFGHYLALTNVPMADTVIVDSYKGWKWGEQVFPNYGVSGYFYYTNNSIILPLKMDDHIFQVMYSKEIRYFRLV